VTHLHIPDGVLPWSLWVPGMALALAALALTAWLGRAAPRPNLAYQGAIGALMLAAMAIELPLGPLEYHLSLLGPAGALLGPIAAFQVVFVVSLMLALAGHGGLTVVGWNALVLGAGAALARPVARVLARRLSPAVSLAGATACAQAVAGLLWLAVMLVALRTGARARWLDRGLGTLPVFMTLALPLWLVGVLVESAVAFGLGRFIARVRPDLLPGGAAASGSSGPPAGAAPPGAGGEAA
jgi:cobalt/nickel transport system permease protein